MPEATEPDFDYLFSEELEPTVLPFKVQGRECTVTLKPLDQRELMKVESMMRSASSAGNEDAASAAITFMVTRTVIDFSLWHRPRKKDGALADWQQYNAPAVESQRRDLLEKQLRLNPKFWLWLTDECTRINATGGEAAGNSLASSSS